MSPHVLHPHTYSSGTPQVRRANLNISRDYFSSRSKDSMRPPPARGALSPSYDEDFPTPKANEHPKVKDDGQDFDDLYDMSGDESDVPLFASNSVKRTQAQQESLAIPSPSIWPTIDKLRRDGKLPDYPLSPPLPTPPLRQLTKLDTNRLSIPSSSSAPSLDGSLTSEELSSMSCPPTPDSPSRQDTSSGWGVQLKSEAMQTLRHISVDNAEADPGSAVEPVKTEMKETVPARQSVGIKITPVDNTVDEPLSAISVPSPGGFFSSLNASARSTWSSAPAEVAPNTGTAESFYGVPWRSPDSNSSSIEHVLEFDDDRTAGPPTARRLKAELASEPATPGSHQSSPASDEGFQTIDYDENYLKTLEESAAVNLDRTSLWLQAQDSYISSLVDSTSPFTVVSPSTISPSIRSPSTIPEEASVKSPSKSSSKSVRWADESPTSDTNKALPPSPKDNTYIDGFVHIRDSRKQSDAFVQRRARIDALRLDRSCLTSVHRDQLVGKYELESPIRPKNSRPVSEFYATEDQTVKNHIIDRVQKERQALEQIKPISWNLEATKMLNGGTLLTSPAGKTLFSAVESRVLDLGGQASCDWAWEVALQYPKTNVHTVYTADQAPTKEVEGPPNHRHTVVPNLWTLPFPSNHFDIVSARSLFALLRTTKPLAGGDDDEYDLCLKECMRVLKPGGYLEFALLDADVLRAGRHGQAVAVQFAFNLRTRGYDAQPTRSFLPRLKRAGFGQMRRAWLALPMARREAFGASAAAGGSTAEASLLTGMIGAWAWERWLLKLQVEMGRNEAKLLAEVAGAIEEGADCGAAWRYLSGWARKG